MQLIDTSNSVEPHDSPASIRKLINFPDDLHLPPPELLSIDIDSDRKNDNILHF